ncbi:MULTISPECIES: type III secretion system domain-containing protein [Citrobacter]|uniref:type III secretion system domain-containing protein n=1 Tax=Citrobacter TaxID=544 RepID=UPI000DF1077E|nr:type III secretion system domain-containing protein [Citrobacter braakii]MBJ9239930.1 hypothetical protein [Citrobacter braakii]WAD30693.1 hypothetical protein MKJ05_21280 [Citrobacter braakii]STA76234.1 T3SS component [Citrobacter freundii]SUX69958.1 T3SS component [Citrobacter freundii]
MRILNQDDFNYYKLINHPLTLIHSDWITELTGISRLCYRNLIENNATRSQLNNVLKMKFQLITENMEDFFVDKSKLVYQIIGKAKILAISGALFEMKCPDYLFSGHYREHLINEMGYENVKQLSFFWKDGDSGAEYTNTNFCEKLLTYGSGNLEYIFCNEPLWEIVKYLLPKSGEIKANNIDENFLNRLNRTLSPYEAL